MCNRHLQILVGSMKSYNEFQYNPISLVCEKSQSSIEALSSGKGKKLQNEAAVISRSF